MKIYLDTIGCRLNQSEIETIGQQFRSQGHGIVANPGDADLAVVNTCAVTNEAAADSRKKIRSISRAGAGEIIATGCWATLMPEQAAQLPSVTRVVNNSDKERLVPEILNVPVEIFDLEPIVRQPLPGAQLRTRAFIKVQDGCDNRCTFCITTLARGQGKSLKVERVLGDIQAAIKGGAKEVVLTGVHLGSWGYDFEFPDHLRNLILRILRRTDIPRLRLSSLEPWDLDESFFEMWENEPRLCRHLHLPLQAGHDATLKRMARKTTQASFARLIEAAREVCPEIAITTDLIAGFPGETEVEFNETLSFVKSMGFAGGHVFTYSPRPGTAAASMPGQVPVPERKERNARLRKLLEESAVAYQNQFIGKTVSVLWESAVGLGPDGWEVTGLTDNYLRVHAHASQDLWNQILPVNVVGRNHHSLLGRLL